MKFASKAQSRPSFGLQDPETQGVRLRAGKSGQGGVVHSAASLKRSSMPLKIMEKCGWEKSEVLRM